MEKKWLLTTLMALAMPLLAGATSKNVQEPLEPHAAAIPPQKYSLGIHSSHYKYAEPDFMESKGYLYGASFYGNLPLHGELFFKVEAIYDYGDTDYTGSGTHKGDPVQKIELRAMAAEDYELDKGTLTPYVGLAYRRLYNDARGITSTGHSGYRRTNTMIYLPLGLDYRMPLGKFSAIFNAELDLMLHGRQVSCLQDVGPTYAQVENDQKSGYGIRLGALAEKGSFAFGPYMQYWHIDCSEVGISNLGDVGVEPDNRTTEIGLELRYNF